MGLFSNNKKPCPVCGNSTPRVFPTKIEGDPICSDCAGQISMENRIKNNLTLEQLKEHFEYRKQNEEKHKSFTDSVVLPVGMTALHVDIEKKLWFIPLYMLGNIKNAPIFAFDELVEFSLMEDNMAVERGNEREYVTLPSVLSGAGAMGFANALNSIAHTLNHLNGKEDNNSNDNDNTRAPIQDIELKIVVSNKYWQNFEVGIGAPALHDNNMNRFIREYNEKRAITSVVTQELMKFFPKSSNISGVDINNEVDQIKKFKELLDGGIINQDEFDKKKKQILGL